MSELTLVLESHKKLREEKEALEEDLEYALFEVDHLQKTVLAEKMRHHLTMEAIERHLQFWNAGDCKKDTLLTKVLEDFINDKTI